MWYHLFMSNPSQLARVVVCSVFDGLPMIVSAPMPLAEAERLAKVAVDPSDDSVFTTVELVQD